MKTNSPPLLIPFLLVMVTLLCKVRAHAPSHLEHHKPADNTTTWELLQAIANRIPLLGTEIREWDVKRYWLWDIYRRSTTSRKPTSILDINEDLTQWEYLNSRIDMIGLILFGPENARSIIRSVRVPGQDLVDELQCLESTTQLFYKHCGCIHEHCLRRFPAFANMCNHAVDKAAIKEALAFACGMDELNPFVVNVENPTITRFAPAPVRGSSEYCERLSVEGVSRMKLGSFSKIYHVLLRPSDSDWNDEEAQICVHRDASLGLCQCEKDDWRSLEDEQWSFVMSPYEQLFVDVKLSPGTSGFVSVYLHEVSQGWRYVLLAIGFSLLFWAPVASKCLPSDYSSNTVRILAVRAIALTFIFQSSIDTLFAMVAVVTCLTVYILTRFINASVTSKKRKLERLSSQELTEVRGYKLPSRGKQNTTVKGTLGASGNINGNGNINGDGSEIYGDFLHVPGDLCKVSYWRQILFCKLGLARERMKMYTRF